MAKTDRLKAKLKSADRRRRRRTTVNQPPQTESVVSTISRVDVPELLARSVMDAAEQNLSLRDSAVIASLRGLISGSEPNSAEAQQLYRAMADRLSGAEVGERESRRAAEELLKLALRNQDSERPDQFLQYLTLISG